MAELHHECGIAAVYHLSSGLPSPIVPHGDPALTAWLIPRLLLEIQNRGQLAAGMTAYHPQRERLLNTHKDVGIVTEVFRMNRRADHEQLMQNLRGAAAIGHVRYATCGDDDAASAQPFERPHIEKFKWFSFAFNGQLANFESLRQEILAQPDFHLARNTDTEILLHLMAQQLRGEKRLPLSEVLSRVSSRLDGAYNLVFMNAAGEMCVARDPLGFRPLCYAFDGALFAAASESVALTNVGFQPSQIQTLPPGHAAIIRPSGWELVKFASSPRRAHCFFEWIYFANVASTLDERSVYLTRKRLGEELARQERLPIDEHTIVVPVPDTAKAAADAMAYALGIPSLEGLIRNRYLGRTFIEGSQRREDRVRMKYTPLPEVLRGKRILLVEDTIVRSTTMQALIRQLKDPERGGAREVHVRVACPPIVAPCFYGIDMSTVRELFAPRYVQDGVLTPELEDQMASALGADSLRYLSVEAISRSLQISPESLCQACLTGDYPTPAGRDLYQLALHKAQLPGDNCVRTYEAPILSLAATP
ncbi:MAG: amidophosphoribosyltransferase [Planctomycetaceae bacterium]|nr:MAG: amidophosphoribosyltransferase [Planctomycetaceae bacterium]